MFEQYRHTFFHPRCKRCCPRSHCPFENYAPYSRESIPRLPVFVNTRALKDARIVARLRARRLGAHDRGLYAYPQAHHPERAGYRDFGELCPLLRGARSSVSSVQTPFLPKFTSSIFVGESVAASSVVRVAHRRPRDRSQAPGPPRAAQCF